VLSDHVVQAQAVKLAVIQFMLSYQLLANH